jgi:hypothetical protein
MQSEVAFRRVVGFTFFPMKSRRFAYALIEERKSPLQGTSVPRKTNKNTLH